MVRTGMDENRRRLRGARDSPQEPRRGRRARGPGSECQPGDDARRRGSRVSPRRQGEGAARARDRDRRDRRPSRAVARRRGRRAPLVKLAHPAPLSGASYSAVELLPGDREVELLDQRALPVVERYERLDRVEQVAEAIETLAVRGAPAIGIAAAYGLVLAAAAESGDAAAFAAAMERAGERLRATRPTAVNLAWALARMAGVVREVASRPAAPRVERLAAEARSIHREDVAACWAMGKIGARRVPDEAVDPHALQRGRAGDRRLRDGARRRARRARGGQAGARRRLRDAPGPPGRAADGVGARARRVRRDARSPTRWSRSSCGAAASTSWSSGPTASRARATSRTRSAPTGWRASPSSTACRSTWRPPGARSTSRAPTATPSPSSSEARAR